MYCWCNFFPDAEKRRGRVPVHPLTDTWYVPSRIPCQYDEHTCTMFPLRLAWAWTSWKVQGQTIFGKVSLCQGRVEREHGLTYAALSSRVTKFSDIGLHDGIT
eukprot:6199916-Ditylum_brightwellii.AAC.1